jgi:hypothetical protein
MAPYLTCMIAVLILAATMLTVEPFRSGTIRIRLENVATSPRWRVVRHAVPDESQRSTTEFNAKAWLDPNTRGGILVWSTLLTVIPIAIYNVIVKSGMNEVRAGATVGASFVLLTTVLWASSYLFRVANKGMTYAKQLQDYDDAVLQKRLDELSEAEVAALLESSALDEKQKRS